MSNNSIQVVGETAKAVGGLAKLITNPVDTATKVVELGMKYGDVSTTLENSNSCMEAKMNELGKTRDYVKDKYCKYWLSKKRYDLWMNKFNEIEGFDELKTEFSNLRGMSIHINEQKTLTGRIDRMCATIDKLIAEGKELEDALVKTEIKRFIKLVTPVSIKKIEELWGKMEKILEYLEEEGIDAVRVVGDPGTGKRAILEHLNNHLVENCGATRLNNHVVENCETTTDITPLGANRIKLRTFDIVLWVPASDCENHQKAGIQNIIVKRLGLNIEGNNGVNATAEKIRSELDGVKYLLLLDDLKVDVDFEAIGIPTGTNGSKIVFTTYLKHLSVAFGKFFDVRTQKLSDDDACQMFEDILIQNNITITNKVRRIARRVVRWCDGVFFLIKMAAENFKSKNVQSWEECLQMLRKPAEKGDTEMKPLENILDFSYHGLNEKQKHCFLICVLYPNGSRIPIDCLYDCWKANKYAKDGALHGILNQLLEKGLLEECSNKQYVTMVRVFWEATMKILQQHETIKCLLGSRALKKLKKNCCEDTQWISLTHGGTQGQALPKNVKCPKLTTLFLQKNPELKNISDSFVGCEDLIVLDLYGTGIETVHPLSNYTRLKVLYVNGCNLLEKVPFHIKGLENLEVLDIRGIIMNEIPNDIKNLKRLMRLMLSINRNRDLSSLKISELLSLEELIIDVKLDGVREEKRLCMSCYNDVIEDTIQKVDDFKSLKTFQFRFKNEIHNVIQVKGDTSKICVPRQGSLERVLQEERDICSDVLQVYIGIQMSSELDVPTSFDSPDSFLVSCDKIIKDDVIQKVFSKVKALILIRNNSINHLDDVGMSESSMNHIQYCFVQRCSKIETLMKSGGFSILKTLILSECFLLKVLFPNNVVHKGIEHLEIRDCSAVEEINMSTVDNGDVFPKLKNLVLYDLRKLKRISPGMEWPSTETVKIHGCHMLEELPLNTNNAKNLKTIKVEETCWGNMQLSDEIKQKFKHLCDFSDKWAWL